jgi:hypothetical protein
VFDIPGTFPYYCVYHPSMVGEIHVNEPEQPKDENDQNN